MGCVHLRSAADVALAVFLMAHSALLVSAAYETKRWNDDSSPIVLYGAVDPVLCQNSALSLLRFGGQVDYANRFASKSLSSNSMGLTFRSVECRRLGL